MGEFVRTIVIGVPINVIYSALKEYYLSPLEEEWRQGAKSSLMPPHSLARDVPNSELVFNFAQMGGKAEQRYVLRSLQENVTEVTFQMKHKWMLAPETFAVQVRDALRMLEYGYKSGKG